MRALDRMNELVAYAKAESEYLKWPALDQPSELLAFKGWVRSYTEEFIRLLSETPTEEQFRAAAVIDGFFSTTMMNGLLDHYVLTFVIRDELTRVVESLRRRGLPTRRLDFNWPGCTERWSSMDSGATDRVDEKQLEVLRTVSGLFRFADSER